MVDSCANRFISKIRNDFVSISTRECHINGTGGKTTGYVGILKPNKVGQKYGIFMDIPGTPITRILGWLGDQNLADRNYELHFNGTGGEIFRVEDNARIRIVNDPEINLPVLGEEFLFKNDSSWFTEDLSWEDPWGWNPRGESKDTSQEWICGEADQHSLETRPEGHGFQVGGFNFLTKDQRDLKMHERHHWHTPGLRVHCPACAKAKGSRKPHAETREQRQEPIPLRTLATDFATGVSVISIRQNRCILVVICDCIKKVWIKPLQFKHECADALREVIEEIRQKYSKTLDDKVVWFLRRDCEPVLGTPEMCQLLQTLRIIDAPSVPYNSEMNGTVERFIQTMSGTLRSQLVGVDKRLWDFAAEYLGMTWNMLPHTYAKIPRYDGRSPDEILDDLVQRKSSQTPDKFRRFGSLCYFRLEGAREGTRLEERWQRAVFLGLCPKTSGWIVGAYLSDNRAKSGMKFHWPTSNDVKFYEHILIRDLDWLKPESKGLYVPYDYLDRMHSGVGRSHNPALGQDATLAHRLDDRDVQHRSDDTAGCSDEKFEIGFLDWSKPSEASGPKEDSPSSKPKRGRSPERNEDPPKRKRGRPPGSKNKKGRKTGAARVALIKNMALLSSVIGKEDFDEFEEFVEAHVLLSIKQALDSPQKAEWKQALDKEEARLLLYETWKPATDQELANASQILPIAVILTIKRCGTYKARACVLGNLDYTGSLSTFAPVASQAANRLLFTCAASEGDHIIPYDLDSAFLNAELDRDVFCRLPRVWADKHGHDVVKLKKALYGLKDAPRAWYAKFTKILRDLSWEPCDEAPGLWRKPSKKVPGKFLKKSVYVDDNLLAGPHKAEAEIELGEILKHVKGRIIPMREYRDAEGYRWVEMDFLGSDVHYSAERLSFVMNSRNYIEKMAIKFKIVASKPVHSPNFDEKSLTTGKIMPEFPSRSVIGALQWVATTTRPDISVPTSTLAKYVAEPATVPFAKACRKVIKYLITTKDMGIEYSPEGEANFNQIYSKLLPEGREIPKLNLFSDASFANCVKTMRSTSGSIAYYRSCPIVWKSSRQGVRAYSTAESEYIAASDTIVLTETNDFMSFFDKIPTKIAETNFGVSPNIAEAVLWVDNQSAICTAKDVDNKPKSRHYALRYLRVRDYAGQIVFCPTNLQKADGLTKVEAAVSQRRLLLHHIVPDLRDNMDDNPSDSEEEEGLVLVLAYFNAIII